MADALTVPVVAGVPANVQSNATVTDPRAGTERAVPSVTVHVGSPPRSVEIPRSATTDSQSLGLVAVIVPRV